MVVLTLFLQVLWHVALLRRVWELCSAQVSHGLLGCVSSQVFTGIDADLSPFISRTSDENLKNPILQEQFDSLCALLDEDKHDLSILANTEVIPSWVLKISIKGLSSRQRWLRLLLRKLSLLFCFKPHWMMCCRALPLLLMKPLSAMELKTNRVSSLRRTLRKLRKNMNALQGNAANKDIDSDEISLLAYLRDPNVSGGHQAAFQA